VDGGIARSIGVSNFTTEMMRVTKKHLGERVKVNQVEFHPVLNQAKVLACSREIDLPLVAYSPLARGRATALPAVHQVARSLGRPASAVVLRWILQCGVKLVVKSERRERCAEFLQAPEFELSRVQMEAIGAESHANFRVVDHVPWKPQWD
jgi:diketogulonate reductase-like aldo/keto reductase